VANSSLLNKTCAAPIVKPGLPGWPFLGRIPENGPRFKLVDLKKLFGLFWLHLRLAGLKKLVWLFGYFCPFYIEKVFLWHHIYKMFATNAMLDRCLRSDVIKIWDVRFETNFLPNH